MVLTCFVQLLVHALTAEATCFMVSAGLVLPGFKRLLQHRVVPECNALQHSFTRGSTWDSLILATQWIIINICLSACTNREAVGTDRRPELTYSPLLSKGSSRRMPLHASVPVFSNSSFQER